MSRRRLQKRANDSVTRVPCVDGRTGCLGRDTLDGLAKPTQRSLTLLASARHDLDACPAVLGYPVGNQLARQVFERDGLGLQHRRI